MASKSSSRTSENSATSTSYSSKLFSRTSIYSAAILLRIILIAWSRYQDAHSPIKYTDIDYFVFTDAARFVSKGLSPYDRATYRYTPLLSWILLPTVWWFDFGKVLFAGADILAGWLLERVLLEHYGLNKATAVKFAAVWLVNPMVAGISTRGSCEGLLGVLAAALVLTAVERRTVLAGIVLGFAVHFKIYPFIYATSLVWYLETQQKRAGNENKSLVESIKGFVNKERITLGISALSTFMAFNLVSYYIYGPEYIEHSWTYHVTRLDHRHNFSIYNTLLHLQSSPSWSSQHPTTLFSLEKLAFAPQLILSAILLPLSLSKLDLPGSMLCQTFSFVAFNKVCTSQYFLWYLIFLPLYLPNSALLKKPVLGLATLVAWVAGQAYWLAEGYKLEFLGEQRFVPGLWLAGVVFFGVNCWILGVLIEDVGSRTANIKSIGSRQKKKV